MTSKLFYILMAYLPFQIALNVAEGIDLASGRVLILLLFLFVIFETIKKKQQFIKPDFIGISLIFFFIFAAISLTQAEIPEWGLRKLLFFASIFPLYFITKHLLMSDACPPILGRVNKLKIIKILVYGAVIISAFGIIQFISQFIFGIDTIISLQSKYIAPLFYGQSFGEAVVANPSWLVNVGGKTLLRAFSIFPDPHNFSLYLGMILPLSVFLLINRYFNIYQNLKLKTQNIFIYTLPTVIILIGILLSFSRSAYVAFIFSIVFSLIVFLRYQSKASIKNFLHKNKFIFNFLYVILIFNILFLIFSPVGSRFLSSFNLQEGSNLGRIEMWKAGWNAFVKNPFFGVGLGNFPLQVERFSEYRQAINTHNTYLDIASEIGIFGLFAWLILMFGTIYKLSKIFFQKILLNFQFPISNFQQNNMYLALIISLIWFATQSFFEVSIYSPVNLAILMIILGMANQAIKQTR